MTLEMMLGVLRSIVAAVGGWLVGKGLLDASLVEQISGGLITLATAAYSVWSKTKHRLLAQAKKIAPGSIAS